MKNNSNVEYEKLQKELGLAFGREFRENTKVRDIYEPWSGGLEGEALYKVLRR